MKAPRRRWFRAVLALVTLAVASLAAPAVRTPILRASGEALVVQEPLVPVDVIVVATGTDGAGVLEAADLVHGGVSARVAVFADPPDPVDAEFLRRGVPYDDDAERSVRQLRALGIATVEYVPRVVAGTEDEARALPAWCDEHGFRSVVVVTTSDHSRRLSRLLRRAMKGRATRITVRPARYSPFDPDRWWQTREGARIGIVELQKLGLDVILHPFS